MHLTKSLFTQPSASEKTRAARLSAMIDAEGFAMWPPRETIHAQMAKHGLGQFNAVLASVRAAVDNIRPSQF